MCMLRVSQTRRNEGIKVSKTENFAVFSTTMLALILAGVLLAQPATIIITIIAYWFAYQACYGKQRKRRWCVFDANAPQEHQVVVEAVTPLEAIGVAAQEIFDLDVEEAA